MLPAMPTPPKSFDHLATALPEADPAFDAFFDFYLRAQPSLVEGAAIEFTREQLRTLLKLAFLAGRECQLDELSIDESLGLASKK